MTEASFDEIAIGSPIRLEHSHHESARSTVGPLVRIKENGDICFLTAWHKFKSDASANNESYIGRRFVPVPRFANETCGEIVAIQLNDLVDAALVKISSDSVPKRCRFAMVKEGQLEKIGLGVQEFQPSYDIDAVDPSLKLFHEQSMLKVVKFGSSSGLTEGRLLVEEKQVKRLDVDFRNKHQRLTKYRQQYKVIPANHQAFCEDGDTGAATFLIDENYHLHCIGMVIRSLDDGSALVTPIQTILEHLGQNLGKNLELATLLDHKNDLFTSSGFDHKDKRQFELALKDGKEMDNFVKLMIVGQYNQGKTSLTNRFLDLPVEKTESTRGIDVHIKSCRIDGDRWVKNPDPIEEGAMRLYDAKISTEPSKASEEVIYSRGSYNTDKEKNINLSLEESYSHVPNKDDKASTTNISSPTVNRLRHSFVELIKNKDSSKNEKERFLFVNIWDFGGQVIYYATHQIFHSMDAIYILVFDLRQDLDSTVVNADFPDMRYTMTMKDHLKFWVYSIHSFVGSTETKEPTIILVGTHKKDMSEDVIDEKFYKILDLFSGKPAREHIYQDKFAVDNADPDDDGIKKLKKAIYDIGFMKAKKRHLPTRWIPLDIILEFEKHRCILEFDELLSIFKEEGHNIEPDEMKPFLKYQNSKGNVVYFDEDGLKQYVVVDPQFLVDAFKCILKSKEHCKWDAELHPLWNNLMESAVLEKKLIVGVWNEYKFSSNREILLNFLKRHKILAEILKFDDKENKYTTTGKYMVPSLLKNECDKELLVSCLRGKTTTVCSLRFEFDDVAILRTLYERVSAASLAKWPPVLYKEQKMVFRDLGIYRLDHQYAGMIMLKEDEGLELLVIAQCSSSTFADVCDRFRRCIELAVEHEFKRHRNNARGKPYKYQLSCNHADHGGKGSTKANDIESVRTEKSISCPDNEAHTIAVPIAITQWFYASRDIPTNPEVMLPPTQKDLCKIAESIGDNWILFGIEQLDLSKDTIERIKMDQTSSGITTVILYMLFEWQKSNPKSSISTLIEKMRNCEALSVNWDKINNLLEQEHAV